MRQPYACSGCRTRRNRERIAMPESADGLRALNLRAGEWVEVRSREEIVATLDEDARLEDLPFMPEMLQ